MKKVMRCFLPVILAAVVGAISSGCSTLETAWEKTIQPLDGFSRAVSGQSAYEKKMERYERAVAHEQALQEEEELQMGNVR